MPYPPSFSFLSYYFILFSFSCFLFLFFASLVLNKNNEWEVKKKPKNNKPPGSLPSTINQRSPMEDNQSVHSISLQHLSPYLCTSLSENWSNWSNHTDLLKSCVWERYQSVFPGCSLECSRVIGVWNVWLQPRIVSFTFFQVLYKYYHFSLGITMRKIFRVLCEGTCQKDFTRSWNFHSSVNTVYFLAY